MRGQVAKLEDASAIEYQHSTIVGVFEKG